MSTSRRPAGLTYRFEDFEVDVSAYEVRRGGTRVPLSGQPMEVLLILLERRHELVSREDIAKLLWAPDVFTDVNAGIHTAIRKIRHALGDSRESPRLVATVPGKGYRFVASVDLVAPSVPGPSPLDSAAERLPLTRRHNLPLELTSFVGRQKELLELPRVFAASRMISFTGAGGVGKTRLALRFASLVVTEFPDGVWLVDLASLALPDLVFQTVAATLGIREGRERSVRDALRETLRHRQLLLVLDNCEHLLTACAELVEELLLEAPALRILTTSREAFGVPGETSYRVPSLSLPEAHTPIAVDALGEFDATQLFLERARAADPAFMPGPNSADAICRICRRLDGIPLAIELAAARVVVLSPGQIEARLEDRFRLLTGGVRTALPRQRTLEATITWSYHLLSDVERQLFSRLSAFPGGWTIEAAEHVCAGDGIDKSEVLDLLSRLVTKSLTVVDREVSGECRYRFLETVRQYARERLMEADAVDRWRDRHFDFVFHEFRNAQAVLHGHGQIQYLRRLGTEQENIRAALDWALTSATLAGQGVELAGALFWFWTKRGQFQEGELYLQGAVAAADRSPASLRARAIIGLAHMHYFQGRILEAGAGGAEALALGREVNDSWVMSVALFLQALTAFDGGDFEKADARAVEARAAADAGGEDAEHAGPLITIASVAALRGEYDRAQQLFDESIEVQRRAGDVWGLTISLSACAGLRIVRGDLARARAHALEALSASLDLEDPRGIAWSLHVFAGLVAASELPDQAARLWGAADRLLESVSSSVFPPISWIRDRYIETVKRSLGEAAFDEARTEGRTMSLADVIALVHRSTSQPAMERE